MNHINVSAQLSRLGDVCFDKQDFSKAIKYYNQSLKIIEHAEGFDLNLIGCVASPGLSTSDKEQIIAGIKKKLEDCHKSWRLALQ